MKHKVDFYNKLIYTHGIVTVLNVLNYCEKEEQYEECLIIVRAIKQHNINFEDKLETKVDENSIKRAIEAFLSHFNLVVTDPEKLKQAYKEYAEEIIKKINKGDYTL